MTKIELITEINSPINICFDLSRSIDLHKISTAKTNEQAVDGRTSGLINLNEFVTWRATHFGLSQRLTSIITEFDPPNYFVDEQLSGPFKSIRHEHKFEKFADTVIMKDIFVFSSPFGSLGKLIDKFILKNYLRKLLIERNSVIKSYAETGKWKLVLNGK